MEVITDYFDFTFCINLLSRPDKREESSKEFIKHGLDVVFYEAINGDNIRYSGPIKKGNIGCSMSHRAVIKLARYRDDETVLIFEDDVAFDDDLNTKFYDWIKEVPPDWDMLYLGGNHNTKSTASQKISEHVLSITNTYTTHAYALRKTVYDMIITRLENIDLEVDVMYAEIQKQCKAYCFTPRLAWQRPGISDIWNLPVDYNFLKDNDGCHK